MSLAKWPIPAQVIAEISQDMKELLMLIPQNRATIDFLLLKHWLWAISRNVLF